MSNVVPVMAGDIAEYLGGALHGNPNAKVRWICSLDNPQPECLAFAKSLDRLSGGDPTQKGVVLIVPAGGEWNLSGSYIAVVNPRLSFGAAVTKFFASRGKRVISPGAYLHATSKIGRNVAIGQGCVIGADVTIGDDTELRNNVIVGDRVRIGRRCLIKSNTVIGEEGFGIEKDAQGRNTRIPHLGSVVIGDDVEIGALNIVASGTIDPTIIEDRVKTDDHVHIAHNCHVGENTIITACAEISGSVKIGHDVWLGPNCSIVNNVSIADNTFVGIGAVVTKNLTVPGTYAGVPARLLSPKSSAQS